MTVINVAAPENISTFLWFAYSVLSIVSMVAFIYVMHVTRPKTLKGVLRVLGISFTAGTAAILLLVTAIAFMTTAMEFLL